MKASDLFVDVGDSFGWRSVIRCRLCNSLLLGSLLFLRNGSEMKRKVEDKRPPLKTDLVRSTVVQDFYYSSAWRFILTAIVCWQDKVGFIWKAAACHRSSRKEQEGGCEGMREKGRERHRRTDWEENQPTHWSSLSFSLNFVLLVWI